MNDPTKNILIGLFVVSASAIVVFVMLFLHPSVGDEREVIKVRFADIDKITVGTRVTYGGKPVGEVVEIQELPTADKDPRKPQRDNYIYLYLLTLRVDSHVKVYNTDQIYSRTSGLLGEKSVEITPMPARPGEKVYLVTDEILYADETGSVEETLKEFKELADKVEATLDSFKFAIDELNRSKIWENLGATAKNLNDITTELNIPGKWANTLTNVASATKNIDEISSTIAQGKGTIGSLLMKNEIYLKIRALLDKGSLIMDDIGNYGVLYQNDKRWQRVKAQRENWMQRLEQPSQFQEYYYNEVNNILGSLDQISSTMYENDQYYQTYTDDEQFQEHFSDLMKRVNDLDESIKLYNQQIVDKNQFGCIR